MRWVLHLNLVIDRSKCYNLQHMCFLNYNWAIISIFCCFRAMTQYSILHLVVNWEVFTINLYRIGWSILQQCKHCRATLWTLALLFRWVWHVWSILMTVSVCLSVCLLAYLKDDMTKLCHIFCSFWALWPWFRPPPVAFWHLMTVSRQLWQQTHVHRENDQQWSSWMQSESLTNLMFRSDLTHWRRPVPGSCAVLLLEWVLHTRSNSICHSHCLAENCTIICPAVFSPQSFN